MAEKLDPPRIGWYAGVIAAVSTRWRNVSIEVIVNSGHQVIDEQPAAVAELLERYATR